MRRWVLLILLGSIANAEVPFERDTLCSNCGIDFEFYRRRSDSGDEILIRAKNWFGPGEHPEKVIAATDRTSPRASYIDGKLCLRESSDSPCIDPGKRIQLNFGSGTAGWAVQKDDWIYFARPSGEPLAGYHLLPPSRAARMPASVPQK